MHQGYYITLQEWISFFNSHVLYIYRKPFVLALIKLEILTCMATTINFTIDDTLFVFDTSIIDVLIVDLPL